MLRDADLEVYIGRLVRGGSFVRVTHIPTGCQRMAGPLGKESPASASVRLQSEIEGELRAAGQHQYLEPGDLSAVVAAISRLWGEGCPVASEPPLIASIAIRRWRSSSQRGVAPDDAKARVRDLARGLMLHFEKEPRIVGPLWREYEPLAAAIDAVLLGSES
jgi:hypothetical protein